MKNPFKPVDFFQLKPGMHVLAVDPRPHLGVRKYQTGVVARVVSLPEHEYAAVTAHHAVIGNPNHHFYLIEEDVLP